MGNTDKSEVSYMDVGGELVCETLIIIPRGELVCETLVIIPRRELVCETLVSYTTIDYSKVSTLTNI